MQIISHSFIPKFIRLECVSHVLAQSDNKKHLVNQPPWHRNPNRKKINQSKQVSAFHPIHICSFISSHSPQRMKRRVRSESHHDFTIFSRASNNISA